MDRLGRAVPLRDIAVLITKGTTPTTMGRAFVDHGIAFIKAESIDADGRLLADKLAYIDEDTHAALRRSQLEPDDVLFSIAGVIGRTALVRQANVPANTNQALAIVRPNKAIVDPRFLYFTLRSAPFQRHSLGRVVQTAQANVSLGVLGAAPLILPPLAAQQRIAAILSTYDDLIENCERRIRVLDEMARALYREWFIATRETPSRMLSAGWKWRGAKDCAEVQYGFPFKSSGFSTDPARGLPVVRIRDVPSGFSSTYTAETADDRYRIQDGDVLVGMDGDFHLAIWSSGTAWLNQRVARFRVTEPWCPLLLRLALMSPIAELNRSIVGTTVAHLGDAHIRQIQFAEPPPEIMARANEVFSRLGDALLSLEVRIRLLRRTRDLLLPRLLSGQLSVGDAG